ncbi:MAG: hypothetical protein H6703_08610 [Myxococcales bacterium]|nr:hypothetical protein [Myxococcales bacterium]
MTPRRVLMLGLAAALAALIGLWLSLDTADPTAPPAAEPGAEPRRSHPAAPRRLTAPRAAAPPPDAPTDAPADPHAPRRRRGAHREPAETWRKLAVHPPDSRPLTPQSADLLDPDRRHERPQRDPDDPAITALFTADRYHLVGDDTLTVILDVRRDDAPAPFTLIDATVRLPDGRAEPYPLAPQGDRHVGLIRPATLGLAAPARLDVQATFDYGRGPRTARLRADYTPEDAIPARWTGEARDAIVDGSLVVTVGVEVDQGGLYLIDANLYAPGGEPIAWARLKEPLTEGPHDLPLRFFGKILVDAGHDGPYTVGELRGALAAPEHTPSRVSMPPYPREITTAPHRAADFSPAEWDAPEKRDRLRRLERLEALPGAPRIGRPPLPDQPAGGAP